MSIVPTGIIPGGMVLIGIPNQDLCDLQIVAKIMETKGLIDDLTILPAAF